MSSLVIPQWNAVIAFQIVQISLHDAPHNSFEVSDPFDVPDQLPSHRDVLTHPDCICFDDACCR